MSSCVALPLSVETVGRDAAAEMVAAPGSDVERSEDFLVLNVAARDRQDLRAEAEFAEFARGGVAEELRPVRRRPCPRRRCNRSMSNDDRL